MYLKRLKDLIKIKNTSWREIIFIIIITFFGIILRSLPSLSYSIWGNDFGIYYAITTAFVNSNNLLGTFNSPWGVSGYGNFPMFYWIILFLHYITGLQIGFLLLHFTPILGGLTVFLIYLIAKKLFNSSVIALLSALFLAINPIQLYQTSMVGLLVAGHFFLLLSMLFLIHSRDKRIYYIPLLFSSVALILSHHLSTFMYIVSLTGVIFWTKLNLGAYRNFRHEVLYLLSFSVATYIFWVVRNPVMEQFMSGAFLNFIPWQIVILIFYGLLVALYYVAEFLHTKIVNFTKNFLKIRDLHYFLVAVLMILIVLIFLYTLGFKNQRLSVVSLLYSIPFIFTLGFIGVGLRNLQEFKNSYNIIFGWFVFLSIAMGYSLATGNGVLFPYRYLEYIFEPLSILAGVGVYKIYVNRKVLKYETRVVEAVKMSADSYVPTIIANEMGSLAHYPIRTAGKTQKYLILEYPITQSKDIKIVLVTLFSIVIMVSAVTAYPFMTSVDRSHEYISAVAMSGIVWLENYGDRNYTIATDHIDGLYLENFGFNSSFEYNYKLWNSTSWTDAVYELKGLNGTYPPIGYVLINSNMYLYGVYGYKIAISPYLPPVYMNKSSFDKFFLPPFEKVFYNSTFDNSQWVYVFQVNWTYINNY